MEFEDLVTALTPPPNRAGKSDGSHEHHLYEGAVMLAYAMHLLRTADVRHVRIHPDGEHGKQFDFAGWFMRRGFAKAFSLGGTTDGGVYRDQAGQTVTVHPKSGLGDVVAEADGFVIQPNARAGSSTPGTPARCRAFTRAYARPLGLLMATPSQGRQVAVAPLTEGTLRLAERLAPRCAMAGIEIALVGSRGQVTDVRARVGFPDVARSGSSDLGAAAELMGGAL